MFDDKKESNENRFIIFFDKKTQTIPAFTDIINNKTDENKSGSITIYPNPVKDKTINIHYSDLQTGKYNVQLINQTGQIIYNSQIIINEKEGLKAIKPGKKIPSGVYQIMLIYRNKKMFNRQVIL